MVYLRVYGVGSKQNESKTLLAPVLLGSLAPQVKNPDVKVAVAKFTYHPAVHLWDFGVKASEHIDIGDIIYILCNDNLYYSKVLLKIYDSRGEIGDLVRWHRIQQVPWKNPIVLDPLIPLDLIAHATQFLKNKVELEQHFFELRAC